MNKMLYYNHHLPIYPISNFIVLLGATITHDLHETINKETDNTLYISLVAKKVYISVTVPHSRQSI